VNQAAAKGRRFSVPFTAWLAERLGSSFIERRVQHGRNDKGDVTGVRTADGRRVCIELKNVARFDLKGWIDEAEREAANDGAPIGVVAFKPPRVIDPSQAYVLMRAETFARLLDPESHDSEARS